MEDKDVDTYLRQDFSEDTPREAFKQKTLLDSTAALVRVRRRRSALQGAELTVAAVLIAGIAFLGGRLSAPQTLPGSAVVPPPPAAFEPDGVTVPSELVAWLDAARLFRQLGMQDRMARAVERACRFLPSETVTTSSVTGQTFTPTGDEIVENKNKQVSLDTPARVGREFQRDHGTILWRLQL
jgi:hypothetical protein